MFGFLGIFGRARELREIDRALRERDLHPRLVPEAVKLTAVRLIGEDAGAGQVAPERYGAAAELLAYCMVGADGFETANGPGATAAVERRIERAIAAGDSIDARLVLLTLHARVIQPSVVARFALEARDRDDQES